MMLTQEEVQHIRQDLLQDGVTDPLLLDDLLDHLCTGIEEQMASGSDFESAYAQLWQQMVPDGAQEIQDATTFLLSLKQYIFMRKFVYISGFVWAFVTLTCILFNLLGLPGVYPLMMASSLLLGAVLIPAFLLYRIKDQAIKSSLEKATYLFGGITAFLLTFGCVFKMMHWAGSNLLLISSILILTVGFLPLLFLHLYKQNDRVALVS